MLRMPARVLELTAARTTSPASSPAISAARRSRHSQVAFGPRSSCRYSSAGRRSRAGGSAAGRLCLPGRPTARAGCPGGRRWPVRGCRYSLALSSASSRSMQSASTATGSRTSSPGCLGGFGWQARTFPLHALAPGEFRVRPGAGLRVGLPRLDGHLGAVFVLHAVVGDRDRGVVVAAPGHRDIQPFPGFAAGDVAPSRRGPCRPCPCARSPRRPDR